MYCQEFIVVSLKKMTFVLRYCGAQEPLFTEHEDPFYRTRDRFSQNTRSFFIEQRPLFTEHGIFFTEHEVPFYKTRGPFLQNTGALFTEHETPCYRTRGPPFTEHVDPFN
jgi:hypothetical protein